VASGQIEQVMVALQQLRARHLMTDASFYKSIVCLAYEASAVNDTAMTLALLQSCPAGYFQSEGHLRQLEDEIYREVVAYVATKLLAGGFIELGLAMTPRKRAAEA
jgi:hypothetical protein